MLIETGSRAAGRGSRAIDLEEAPEQPDAAHAGLIYGLDEPVRRDLRVVEQLPQLAHLAGGDVSIGELRHGVADRETRESRLDRAHVRLAPAPLRVVRR